MRHIPRRIYQRLSRPVLGRLKDKDVAAVVRRLRALQWSGVGAIVGALGGWFKFGFTGLLVGGILAYLVTFFLVHTLVEAGAAVVGAIHNPPGTSTPYRLQYSEPQSLALRGLFQEAIDCYETYVAEFPDDPEPCIGIARIYRDHLKQHEDAVLWFRRARQASGMDPGRETLVTREIIEIFTGALDQPRRAIPELARLADRFAGSREGDLARAELVQLRERLGEASSA